MTLFLITVVPAAIEIVIRTVSVSVVVKRAPTAVVAVVAVVADVMNVVLVTLTVNAAAEVMSAVVLAEKRRSAIENATLNLVRLCVGQTVRVKRQGAETDVIAMTGHSTLAGLLLAMPMMKVVFARRLLWERLHLRPLPHHLLRPVMRPIPLAAGALVVETGATATKTEIVNVSAVVTAVVTGTITVTVAPDIASVDVLIQMTTPVMEMDGGQGWEVIINALVVERERSMR